MTPLVVKWPGWDAPSGRRRRPRSTRSRQISLSCCDLSQLAIGGLVAVHTQRDQVGKGVIAGISVPMMDLEVFCRAAADAAISIPALDSVTQPAPARGVRPAPGQAVRPPLRTVGGAALGTAPARVVGVVRAARGEAGFQHRLSCGVWPLDICIDGSSISTLRFGGED